MKKKLLIFGGLIGLILLLLVMLATMSIFLRGGARNIAVSYETTRLTEPLDSEGFVDYFEAINLRNGRNVTPANNWAAMVIRLVDPVELAADDSRQLFHQMGVPVPAADAPRFVGQTAWLNQTLDASTDTLSAEVSVALDALSKSARAELGDTMSDAIIADRIREQLGDTFGQAQSQPWQRDEMPLVAAWLDENQRALDQVVDAASRDRYYVPLVRRQMRDALFNVLLPVANATRSIARGLQARAMAAAGEGDLEQAFDAVYATLSLGRAQSHGFSLVHHLVAIAIEHLGYRSLNQLAMQRPDANTLRGWLDRLDQLPPAQPMWQALNQGERYMFLDLCHTLARHGGNENLGIPEVPGALSASIDWNTVMATGNRQFDKLVQIGKIENPVARLDAAGKVVTTPPSVTPRRALGALTMSGRSQLFADLMAALSQPAVQAAYGAEVRQQMNHQLARLVIWLNIYHADHGQYPESLDALTPDYLAKIPRDGFTGQPLIYRRHGNDFVLYSVGQNGLDDGGRTDGDEDDIVVGVTPSTSEP